jgi:hypothetical protein
MNTPVYWIEWSGTISQDVLLTGWAALSVTYPASRRSGVDAPGSGVRDERFDDPGFAISDPEDE